LKKNELKFEKIWPFQQREMKKKLKYATKKLNIFIFEIWNENFHLKFGISLE
jgi:hypothetical protein